VVVVVVVVVVVELVVVAAASVVGSLAVKLTRLTAPVVLLKVTTAYPLVGNSYPLMMNSVEAL